jgi:hypothetical protein
MMADVEARMARYDLLWPFLEACRAHELRHGFGDVLASIPLIVREPPRSPVIRVTTEDVRRPG